MDSILRDNAHQQNKDELVQNKLRAGQVKSKRGYRIEAKDKNGNNISCSGYGSNVIAYLDESGLCSSLYEYPPVKLLIAAKSLADKGYSNIKITEVERIDIEISSMSLDDLQKQKEEADKQARIAELEAELAKLKGH